MATRVRDGGKRLEHKRKQAERQQAGRMVICPNKLKSIRRTYMGYGKVKRMRKAILLKMRKEEYFVLMSSETISLTT